MELMYNQTDPECCFIQWINSALLHSWSIYWSINSRVPCPGTGCVYLAGIFLFAVNILYILLIWMSSASGKSCIIQCINKMGKNHKKFNTLGLCVFSIAKLLSFLWILFDCQWICENFLYWFFLVNGVCYKVPRWGRKLSWACYSFWH